MFASFLSLFVDCFSFWHGLIFLGSDYFNADVESDLMFCYLKQTAVEEHKAAKTGGDNDTSTSEVID